MNQRLGLLLPTLWRALRGCQRAEKVIPMLKRWTVFPAIHIMNPIIIRFLNGDWATSHAFCSHSPSTKQKQKLYSKFIHIKLKSTSAKKQKVSFFLYIIHQIKESIALFVWLLQVSASATPSAATAASMRTFVVRFADANAAADAYYIANAGFIGVSRRTRCSDAASDAVSCVNKTNKTQNVDAAAGTCGNQTNSPNGFQIRDK